MSSKMIACANCGKVFTPRRKNGRFCSRSCMHDYFHQRGVAHREPAPGDEILREFHCRTCGKLVRVVDEKDRRSVYFSQQCEKKWWRDVTKYGNGKRKHGGNLGMSGGMSLGSLIRREARDLH